MGGGLLLHKIFAFCVPVSERDCEVEKIKRKVQLGSREHSHFFVTTLETCLWCQTQFLFFIFGIYLHVMSGLVMDEDNMQFLRQLISLI
jgi:hypothetical protein